MNINYKDFLAKKQITDEKSGFEIPIDKLNPMLFDWQKVIVQWGLARGRAAFFEDCGLGKCISEGSIIPTENGFLSIEEIISEGNVLPHDSKKDILISVLTKNGIKKTSYFYKGKKQNCIKITTNMGYDLSGIYSHPILVLDQNGIMKWKWLCDIKLNDYAAIQRKFSLFGNNINLPHFDSDKYKRKGQYSIFEKKKALDILNKNDGVLDKNTLAIIKHELNKDISFQSIRNWALKENIGNVTIPDLPTTLNEDFSYLLGLLVGDGGLTQSYAVSLTSIDSFIIDFFKTQMRLIGIEVKNGDENDITYNAYSSIFKDWLLKLGLNCVYSHEKQIPKIIMTSTQNNIKAFLQGLFDTDGWSLSDCGGVGFGSSSKALAKQVHFLLLQFGIISKLSFKENDFKGSWNISLFGNEARKFYNRIGFRLNRKQDNRNRLPKKPNTNIDIIPYLPKMNWDIFNGKFKNYKFLRHRPSYNKLNEMAVFCPELNDILYYNFFWDRITNIEDIGKRQVYDLNIPDGHNFVANGFVVHNTPQQLEWANQVHKKENEPILILAPLAVSTQTKEEGNKFNIPVNICLGDKDVINGINITNYEKLHKFDPSKFIGIVCDESSILKNFSGTIRNEIIDMFGKTKYRLACTATPSPNDYTELGNHAEFLGIMSRSEMLATFFINDTKDTGTWRMKGHVRDNIFWKWLASWAVMITKPSDLGFEDDNFLLPEIKYHQHIIPTKEKPKFGFFPEIARTMDERRKVRKDTIEIRCKAAADFINATNDKWITWCNLNLESEVLTKMIDNSLEVAGKHSDEIKTKRMMDFAQGKLKRLVTKPKIAGLGMNFQICNKAAFVGLSDSWEQFYQACRRIWRFGQINLVDIHIWIEEREGAVLKNIQRKDNQSQTMIEAMVAHMKELMKHELGCSKRTMVEYKPTKEMRLPQWLIG